MPQHHGLLVEIVTNGPFQENCYLAADETTRQAIIIDPGSEEDRIVDRIRQLELEVQEIIVTHAHIDHAGGVAALKRILGVPFALHPQEKEGLRYLPQQAALFGFTMKEVPVVDRDLTPGETIAIGNLSAQVLYTPGHSAGGCCIYFAAAKTVFVGDTLFSGSIGRSDLPGGSADTLLASIRQNLLALDDEVVVYSGHGPATSIGHERRYNPFLKDEA